MPNSQAEQPEVRLSHVNLGKTVTEVYEMSKEIYRIIFDGT